MDLKNPTRTEALLANIAGHTDVPVPDLKNATRSERLLKEILDNGGGGGGDVTKEYVDTAISNAVADIDDDISALSDTVADKVDKENGKSLSTNDYTDADKALVQDSPITVTATASPISTANGKPRKLTIYGKSEVVDGSIKSAGEGWSVVRLADLEWVSYTDSSGLIYYRSTNAILNNRAPGTSTLICPKYKTVTPDRDALRQNNKAIAAWNTNSTLIGVRDDDYTTLSDFVASLGDATLCYKLADPTQGNAIAVKTDNGTGIDGTMAVFETGTPLRGIPNTDVRDVMEWSGSSGEVTKKCNKVRLADLTWDYTDIYGNNTIGFRALAPANLYIDSSISSYPTAISSIYTPISANAQSNYKTDKSFAFHSGYIKIIDTDYTTVSDFVTSLGDAEMVYEVTTPTTEQLTTAENASIAGLRTFTPQTHAQNNAGAEMTVEAYAGTQNGKAIADLKSELQITQSDILTLTVAGWNNNTQTITYAHDVSKRNSIDVEPANIKAWTAAGILATAETASTITFECDTVPTADLSFRVTSMEVR